MIKLVAIDIDGTLLNDKREITENVKNAIQDAKKAGVKIVITTGRPLPGVKDILDQLNLREEGDYVITYNGALVQATDTGEEFIREPLSKEDFLEIETESRRIAVHMHAITSSGIYTANRNIGRYSVHESFLVNMPLYYRTAEEMGDLEFVKMMYIDEPQILDSAIEKLDKEFYEKYTIVKSAPFYLEILNKKASKGNAVMHLADKLGIKVEETMAIGDEENDRSMLEVVGNPVVMENGNPEIKKLAKYITKSNNEDGVSHAIKTYVLEEK
ncbi:sugar-phosphatase [Floricoccus tropicus]|uniref:Sugar-phosphatase n=1 Tax=Floricoccus tropicus TaxID=1859473 RepID=A0A1E8GMJ5_9LACT|nr:sugar-phosphatase [Floricoccus tropicus]OFI49462.1 sugar-phosphatase [Floricoccus tropicus]